MTEAEVQGSDGHGVIRLVPYARRTRAGGIKLRPDIRVVKEKPPWPSSPRRPACR